MTAWKFLQKLSELPLRGSATQGERTAALWLQEQLESFGYDVQLQPFTSPRHTLYVGPAFVSGVLFVSLFLAKRWPALAFAMSALSFVPLVGEMLGAGPNFDLILPKKPSQNVIARRPQDQEKSDATEIVVVAHYDTQWGSWLFAPSFRPFLRPFFIVTYIALLSALITVGLYWVAPDASIVGGLMSLSLTLLLLTSGFLLLSLWKGRPVPGANDNGSGVAVCLATARKWVQQDQPRLRLTFLFTGCEEVGLRGMHAFVKHTPLAENTMFVNIDNVGGGRLRYLLGEGMVAYARYDKELVALARRVAEQFDEEVSPLKNLLLPTDALVAAKAGFAAITFLATNEDETIPNYHWHTDTFDNADKYTVEQTERFVDEYLHAIAKRVGAL